MWGRIRLRVCGLCFIQIFMNHLDLGFDGIDPTIGYVSNVIHKVSSTFVSFCCRDLISRQYWYEYYPAAIATAQQLRARGGPERLIYTTHSYLVSMFLDCPNTIAPSLNLTCPSAAEQAALLKVLLCCAVLGATVIFVSPPQAIQLGDITWHAFPHNSEPEAMDSSLFRFGLDMTHALVHCPHSVLSILISQPACRSGCASGHVGQDCHVTARRPWHDAGMFTFSLPPF
jgi:hypothetical protein